MKPFILPLLVGVVFISCKNNTSSTVSKNDDSPTTASTTSKMDYPYTIEHPDNWETGSQQNTFNVLSALKAWENGNLDESLKYFADSVRVRFDKLDKMLSKDSLRVLLSPDKSLKSVMIKMKDWESVISKDKKDEYVTLWYTQHFEMMNGKKDSIDIVDDLKMKDGKIIGLDEYRRILH
ncbi:MAG: hypothetical protein E6Q58_04130 [Niabella sp.]|nr:MAG: hypothetical protein E6Q58_04130 [Niabella sp.]